MSRTAKPIKLPWRPVKAPAAQTAEQRQQEAQREALVRRRRQKLLLVGALVSLLVHMGIMLVLSSVYRWRPGGAGPEAVQYEFAILQEEELTQLESATFDELTTQAIENQETLPESSEVLAPDIPAVEMEFAAGGAMPALGGSGEGGDFGLSGGAAGTSFFGVSSSGTRFAYIVDKSGSMSEGRKMLVAKDQLRRSIESLPDYAHFFVVLFSNGITVPNFQDDWMRAKPTTVARVIRWLNSEVDPGGGTEPRTAFQRVFALEVRPDVIFFLTDGEITGFTAEEIAAMNARGKRVVINTIAFGDPTSQSLLKAVAAQSGGVYRFVPSGVD